MDVLEAIRTRRNIKSFKSDPIPPELVQEWLQAAAYAPNHRMTEPWEVLRIGPSTRAALAHKNDFGGAPLVLAVLSAPAKTEIDREEHVQAVACFIQNFMLAAHAAGYGTGWSSLGSSPRSREVLAVAEGYDVVGLIPVGLPQDVPLLKPRTEIERKIRELP